ncbi:hypothetical protein OIU79_012033 [Salix purpurea]|uniref:Uncharacterized protein n=1 Tax=Salix purpurea TaxID=77065 RepID=A0A9Q0Q2V2_SALPP|nr:hypothetical protein OIU79_012033 [Salix purpurea]
MAGDRGRGRHGLIPVKEVHHHDRNLQEEIIADLQRQVAELTQRLAAQNFEKHETTGHDSDSAFDNPYHNRVNFREGHEREAFMGNLGFRVELLEFSGTLQAIDDWLHEVKR